MFFHQSSPTHLSSDTPTHLHILCFQHFQYWRTCLGHFSWVSWLLVLHTHAHRVVLAFSRTAHLLGVLFLGFKIHMPTQSVFISPLFSIYMYKRKYVQKYELPVQISLRETTLLWWSFPSLLCLYCRLTLSWEYSPNLWVNRYQVHSFIIYFLFLLFICCMLPNIH